MDSQYSRRAFVAGSAAGIAGILAASKLGFAAPSSEPSPQSQSDQMLPPLSTDVIVVGAGTSGAPAAIAAARQGAVRLHSRPAIPIAMRRNSTVQIHERCGMVGVTTIASPDTTPAIT